MVGEIVSLDFAGRNYVVRWSLDPFAGQDTEGNSPLFNGDASVSSTIGADIYRDSITLATRYSATLTLAESFSPTTRVNAFASFGNPALRQQLPSSL